MTDEHKKTDLCVCVSDTEAKHLRPSSELLAYRDLVLVWADKGRGVLVAVNRDGHGS